MAKKTFHKFTASLNHYGCEVSGLPDGSFHIQAQKGGRNIPGKQATVTAEELEARPFNFCDKLVEGLWALSKCGITFG